MENALSAWELLSVKEFALHGSKFFPFRVAPNDMGEKNPLGKNLKYSRSSLYQKNSTTVFQARVSTLQKQQVLKYVSQV